MSLLTASLGKKKKSSKNPLSDMFPRKHLETLFVTFEKKVVPCFKKIFIINYIINYINCSTFPSQGKTPKYENPLIIINEQEIYYTFIKVLFMLLVILNRTGLITILTDYFYSNSYPNLIFLFKVQALKS
jgi:hypothetical protein